MTTIINKRWFELSMQALIIISALSFAYETLPNLTETEIFVLKIIDYSIVGIFTFEYLLRIGESKNKLKFIFSFYGLIDLIAILPAYIAFGVVDLKSVRIFRLLRLFRILKFARYIEATNKLKAAFKEMKEEFLIFFTVSMFTMYLSGLGLYYFEHEAQPETVRSVFDGMWWALITLTTVGYGDMYPVTIGGKIFTFIILLLSLGIVAVPTGLFASALSKLKNKE
jgi:voltage-gated potassium channel